MKAYVNFSGTEFTDYKTRDNLLRYFSREVLKIVKRHGFIESELEVGFLSDESPYYGGTGCFALKNKITNCGKKLKPEVVEIPDNLLIDKNWEDTEIELMKSFQRITSEPISFFCRTVWSLLHEIGHAIDNEQGKMLELMSSTVNYLNKVDVIDSYFDIESEMSATRNAVKMAQNLQFREEIIALQDKFPELRETDSFIDFEEVYSCRRLPEKYMVD